jgi:crotonobetaine/carnitine-CoA ligase
MCCAMDNRIFSFAEIDAASDALAGGAAALGLAKGGRVAILTPNRVEMLELFYGLAKAGCVQIPIDPCLGRDGTRHRLAQSRARVLVTDGSGRDAVARLRSELPDLKVIVSMDEPVDGDVPYAAFFEAGLTAPGVTVTAADTMSIAYTSGTSGLPKGCVASHGYYARCAELVGSALEITRNDVLFSAMPLSHADGRLLAIAMRADLQL